MELIDEIDKRVKFRGSELPHCPMSTLLFQMYNSWKYTVQYYSTFCAQSLIHLSSFSRKLSIWVCRSINDHISCQSSMLLFYIHYFNHLNIYDFKHFIVNILYIS